MTRLCCLIRKVKMTKILVVGLAVVLAAAGSARADGTNSQSSTSSATGSAASSGSAHSSASGGSSGSGAVHQGAVAPRSGGAPMVRPYSGNVPAIVNLQNAVRGNVPVNPNADPRVQRQFLDRSEILARQA